MLLTKLPQNYTFIFSVSFLYGIIRYIQVLFLLVFCNWKGVS